jgi:hypothetical protein
MVYKTEVRFGVKDASGDDLILPNDVLRTAATEYRKRVTATPYVILDVETREDALVVTFATLENEEGKRLEQRIAQGSVQVNVDGVVRKSEADENGFPIVREFELRAVKMQAG